MEPIARILIVAGAVFLMLGIIMYLGPSIPFLGRLPGDIRVDRPGFKFYFPLMTCLLLSVVLSVILWLFSKMR